MGKFAPDATLKAVLDKIATATRLDIVTDVATPTNLTNTIANVTLTPGDGNGDFTISDGDTSGRKLRVAAQNATPITGPGDANHIVLSLNGTILHITTGDGQGLVSGGTVDIPAYDIEFTDPT